MMLITTKRWQKCGTNMKRYFVKSHFSDWREVSKDNFDGFVQNIKRNAGGINEQQKEEHLKKVTKIK